MCPATRRESTVRKDTEDPLQGDAIFSEPILASGHRAHFRGPWVLMWEEPVPGTTPCTHGMCYSSQWPARMRVW